MKKTVCALTVQTRGSTNTQKYLPAHPSISPMDLRHTLEKHKQNKKREKPLT